MGPIRCPRTCRAFAQLPMRSRRDLTALSWPRSRTLASRRAGCQLDVPRAAANFRVFADLIKAAGLESFQTETPDGKNALNYAVRKPLGVVGMITPWNLPLLLLTWKLRRFGLRQRRGCNHRRRRRRRRLCWPTHEGGRNSRVSTTWCMGSGRTRPGNFSPGTPGRECRDVHRRIVKPARQL